MMLRLLWRRVRGLISTSIVWAGAWALVGLGIGVLFWLNGETLFSLRGPGWFKLWAEVGALTGALSGGAFSLGVIALERRGDVSAITPFRFGGLGAITAGLVIVLLSEQLLPYGLIGAAIGLVSGSGSVIVARRGLSPPGSTVKSVRPAT